MSTTPQGIGGILHGRTNRRAAVEALAWIAFGAFLWVMTFDFDTASNAYLLGTASWPRAVLVLLFLCAGLQWVQTIRKAPAVPETEAAPESASSGITLSLLGVFGLPLLYVWLLPWTGFFATTPLFTAIYFWLLGERVWWRLALATVTLWVVLLLVFTTLLYVPLPTGNWPGFYEFSNFILSVLR